jgi:hypothetical protein
LPLIGLVWVTLFYLISVTSHFCRLAELKVLRRAMSIVLDVTRVYGPKENISGVFIKQNEYKRNINSNALKWEAWTPSHSKLE